MEDRERLARAVACAVPMLLGVHVETAEPVATEAVAQAVEQLAQELLDWNDRIALGPRRLGAPQASPVHEPRMGMSPHPSATLRASVNRGELPGNPITLQLAATELRAVVRGLESAVLQTAVDPDHGGVQVLHGCRRLAECLDRHSDLLRVERERLRAATAAEQRDQVLARVVRGERGLIRSVAATLTP